jgi:hypothetical protein
MEGPPDANQAFRAEQLARQAAEERAAELQAQLEDLQRDQQARPRAPLPNLPLPEKWDGRGDFFVNYEMPWLRWLQHMRLMDDPSAITYLVNGLPPTLSCTYEAKLANRRSRGLAAPANAEEFFELAREMYPQVNRELQAMAELDRLYHKKNDLVEFNSKFCGWAMVLAEVETEFTLKCKYMKKLHVDVRREVENNVNLNTISLSDLMTRAAHLLLRAGSVSWRR